ncbi:MAG: hypothetical protein DME26_02695 [Verrucomicrobia bacterium]|nr:MAG: hypothetical protein DME26_02695 [Verrucomicrobiota bacterium]
MSEAGQRFQPVGTSVNAKDTLASPKSDEGGKQKKGIAGKSRENAQTIQFPPSFFNRGVTSGSFKNSPGVTTRTD